MKICKNCGIGIGTFLEVSYRKIRLCKICHREERKEQFKYWYDKQAKKKIASILCKVCTKEFTPRTRAIYCSPNCSELAIKIKRKIRRSEK